MKKNRSLHRVLWVALTTLGVVLFAAFPSLLGGQNVDLPFQSDPALRALISQRNDLQMFSLGPFDFADQLTSPDADALRMLNEWASSGADRLRAITDLLSVYDNMQCEADRAMLKPLLEDRLHLYSRLLNLNAEGAAMPLSIIKLPANTKKALKLRDDLKTAKNELDAIAASLK